MALQGTSFSIPQCVLLWAIIWKPSGTCSHVSVALHLGSITVAYATTLQGCAAVCHHVPDIIPICSTSISSCIDLEAGAQGGQVLPEDAHTASARAARRHEADQASACRDCNRTSARYNIAKAMLQARASLLWISSTLDRFALTSAETVAPVMEQCSFAEQRL